MNPLTPEQEQNEEQTKKDLVRMAKRIVMRRQAERLADEMEYGALRPSKFIGTIDEAVEVYGSETKWLIEGLIPAVGISMLHGRFSLGKSPFSWRLAQSISEGMDFFGYETVEQGAVIWIEADEALRNAIQRAQRLEPRPRHLYFYEPNIPLDVVKPSDEARRELTELYNKVKPKLVVINSLRKVHRMDDKDSRTPSIVYGATQTLFPDTAILFIHHDRKQPTDPLAAVPKEEAFSGSQAWKNDAAIALHLRGKGKRAVAIDIDKSQVCELQDDVLSLQLAEDGYSWTDLSGKHIVEAYNKTDPNLTQTKRIEETVKETKSSDSTVRRRLRSAGLLTNKRGRPKASEK